jgi:hypothetical protein
MPLPWWESVASRPGWPGEGELDSRFRGNDLQGGIRPHKTACGFLLTQEGHIALHSVKMVQFSYTLGQPGIALIKKQFPTGCKGDRRLGWE